MGKPWKRKERPQVDLSSDYKWSAQSYTLKGILNNFKLPVVVQCREETNASELQNFFFDLKQPVLLHSKRTSRKVFARCIRKGDGGTIKELLPEVVIPEDYAGWFKLSKGLQFDKPSPHRSIESVLASGTDFFLCTTEFNAVVVTDSLSSNDPENLSDCIIRPVVEGEVLRKIGIEKINQLMLPEPLRSQILDSRFLLCIDEKDAELLVPIRQTGLFYEVSDGNVDKTTNTVLQISDILDEMLEMPIYVRHILGDPPPISKFYSPCLKLMRVKEEESVMGSTLDTDEDALPLEIQTISTIKFEIALNTPMLQSCSEYMEAVEMCNNMGQTYVTDMKLAVIFKVKEDETPDQSKTSESYTNPTFENDENLDSITNSQATSTSLGKESELGDDVDANSEFSIDWKVNQMLNKNISPNSDKTPVMLEPDSISIDSVDTVQAKKLNSVLGGRYFGDDDGQREHSHVKDLGIQTVSPPILSKNSSFSGSKDSNVSLTQKSDPIRKSNEEAIMNKIRELQRRGNEHFLSSNSSIESCRRSSNSDITYVSDASRGGRPTIVAPSASMDDVVEEITDFSVNTMLTADSGSGPSTSTAILRPPSPFNDEIESMPSSVTVSMSKIHSSSTSTLASSSRSQIDLSDHFPSIHSSVSNISAEIIDSQESDADGYTYNDVPEPGRKGYTFTGDVFISPSCDTSDLSCASSRHSSNGSIDKSWETWNENRFRVIRSKDLPPFNQRQFVDNMTNNLQSFRSASLTDDLMKFDEPSKTSSTNDILTCKVADEMVSSCNDLRLSLDEITKTARDNHTENSWKQFCLERSSSLPVRTKIDKSRGIRHTDEHSQSWEQISPRSNYNSNESTPRNQTTNLTRSHYKDPLDFSDNTADKTQLLNDNSSEESFPLSRGSMGSLHQDHNTSFAMSENSDMSVTDGPESVLAAIAEMDYYLDEFTSDTGSSASRRSNSWSVIAQKLKIESEIKKKQLPLWNDVVEVI
ncbi:hypothetical protein ACF0H5_004374 [Mactra antiquata]